MRLFMWVATVQGHIVRLMASSMRVWTYSNDLPSCHRFTFPHKAAFSCNIQGCMICWLLLSEVCQANQKIWGFPSPQRLMIHVPARHQNWSIPQNVPAFLDPSFLQWIKSATCRFWGYLGDSRCLLPLTKLRRLQFEPDPYFDYQKALYLTEVFQ